MITKFVLIIWIGYGQTQSISTQSFNTEAECQAVATALKNSIHRSGWFRCVPYIFEGEPQ